MFFGVAVPCRNLYSFVGYLYVSGSGSITSVGKRELIGLLLVTCNHVVSFRSGFLFLCVLGMGYVILLWHSLSLPYNYLNALRQMQTVWDSNLLAMFMFWLFLKI